MSKKITLQAAFDKVWNHFVVNRGKPSADKDRCLYFCPDGANCAFAILVPEDKRELLRQYDGRIVNCTASAVLAEQPEIAALFDADPESLDVLQGCHDQVAEEPAFHAKIRTNLLAFARDFSLIIPEAA